MTIRRTKKPRIKRTFNAEKIKAILATHAQYAVFQIVGVIICDLFWKMGATEPFHFCLFGETLCGFWMFPIQTTRRINRIVLRQDYSGMWGNAILQSAICAILIRFILPFEASIAWRGGLIVTLALSLFLLLVSTMRRSYKPSPKA